MDFSVVLVIAVCTAAALRAVRGLESREQRLAMLAFGAHVFATFVHWGLYEFFWKQGGDMYMYQENGVQLARLMEFDPLRFVPEVAKLALHREALLPLDVEGVGTSTGTMSALAGFIVLLVGPALLSNCMLTSFMAWLGQFYLYRAAREELGPRDRPAAAVGLLLTPSVVFWGAGFVKEALVLALLGPMVFSMTSLLKRRKVKYLVTLTMAAIGVAMCKSYTLVAFVLAGASYFYADRAWRAETMRIRPVYLVLAGALALGGVVGAAALFPEYSSEHLAEQLAQHQENAHLEEGGSSIDVGNEGARSLPRQVAFAPVALVNALFRPAIVEVRNGPMVLAGLENTFIVISILSLFGPLARTRVVDIFRKTPLLVFSAVFVVVFGTGVGLATGNLGTLSRYRAPMMPFLIMMLLVLRSRSRVSSRETTRAVARARLVVS